VGSIGAATFGESDVFTDVSVDDDGDDGDDGDAGDDDGGDDDNGDDGDDDSVDDDDDDEVDEDDKKSELMKTEPPMTMVAVSNLRWLCFLMAYLSIYCNVLFVLYIVILLF